MDKPVMEPTHIPTAASVDAAPQHTPGPWTFNIRPSHCGSIAYVTTDRDRIEICVLYGDDQQIANARLIAAAPELLAALKAMSVAFNVAMFRREISAGTEHSVIAEAAQAAIANAEGRR